MEKNMENEMETGIYRASRADPFIVGFSGGSFLVRKRLSEVTPEEICDSFNSHLKRLRQPQSLDRTAPQWARKVLDFFARNREAQGADGIPV